MQKIKNKIKDPIVPLSHLTLEKKPGKGTEIIKRLIAQTINIRICKNNPS